MHIKRNLLDKKFHFVITGNHSTGKSSILQILKCKGYNIVDADYEIAKLYTNPKIIDLLIRNRIVKKKSDIKQQIKEFILRKKTVGLDKLESIIIPKLLEAFDVIIKKNNLKRKKLIFFELPTLFENQLSDNFNQVLVVGTNKLIQKQRQEKRLKQKLKANEPFFEKQVSAEKKISEILIKRQYSYAKQKALSNFVIYNGSNKAFLIRKINHYINTSVRQEIF